MADIDTNAPMVEEADAPIEDPKAKLVADKKRHAQFRQYLAVTKEYRKKLVRNWSTNIDFRRGKLMASQSDEDSVAVNLDWSYTKSKQAALFSQVPQARVSHSPESVGSKFVAPFERDLNDTLRKSGIAAAMDEVMPDCINAAGIGVVLVSHEQITEPREVPNVDLSIFPPEVQKEIMQSGTLFGTEIQMKTVPHTVAKRYVVKRISPADFLWPLEFTGSDFDNASWLGYTGSITWAEAVKRFNLTEEDKDKVLTDEKTVEDRLSSEPDRELVVDDGKVGFDEIFYHEHQYHEDCKSFDSIRHLVFLHGKTDPVIDEPWQGQIEGPDGQILGCRKKPIRVLTLTYITDEDIPPSDSAVARPQVIELNKGRTHMNKQRRRNIPHSWFDVNRLDSTIQQALMRGTWDNAIPVQGDGNRVIGTVQQPAMPQENFIFDKVSKQDAQEIWTIGPNQIGVGGDVETKGESNIIERNFMTKVGRERARVAEFFVGIAEVLGSLMCVYEDPKKYGEGFDPSFAEKLSYSILADSTVLVTAEQRLERLNNYLDKYAKSGWINIEPVLKEITTLIGLDPNTTVRAPQPQSPEPPNISLRLTGGDDMMNPLLLAFMIKAGQAPTPENIDQAKKLIESSVVAPAPGQNQPGPMPPPPPENTGDANPKMGLLPSIGKRSGDPGQEGVE